MYVQCNIEVHSFNDCCCGEAMCIPYSMCVFVTSVIKHAKCMPCIIATSVAFLALQYFSALSHKLHDFRKNVIGYKMGVLILSTSCIQNISNSKKK